MQALASGPKAAVSQDTELAPVTGEGTPCLDGPPASYTAGQKNQSLEWTTRHRTSRPSPPLIIQACQGVLIPLSWRECEGPCKATAGEGGEQRQFWSQPAAEAGAPPGPEVLAPGPALPCTCPDFGSLSLGFLIWAVRALEEKISGAFPIQ